MQEEQAEAIACEVLEALEAGRQIEPFSVRRPSFTAHDAYAVTAELRRNLDLAGKIDDSVATPTFVIGGQMLKGAVGYDALKEAIGEARKRAGA